MIERPFSHLNCYWQKICGATKARCAKNYQKYYSSKVGAWKSKELQINLVLP